MLSPSVDSSICSEALLARKPTSRRTGSNTPRIVRKMPLLVAEKLEHVTVHSDSKSTKY